MYTSTTTPKVTPAPAAPRQKPITVRTPMKARPAVTIPSREAELESALSASPSSAAFTPSPVQQQHYHHQHHQQHNTKWAPGNAIQSSDNIIEEEVAAMSRSASISPSTVQFNLANNSHYAPPSPTLSRIPVSPSSRNNLYLPNTPHREMYSTRQPAYMKPAPINTSTSAPTSARPQSAHESRIDSAKVRTPHSPSYKLEKRPSAVDTVFQLRDDMQDLKSEMLKLEEQNARAQRLLFAKEAEVLEKDIELQNLRNQFIADSQQLATPTSSPRLTEISTENGYLKTRIDELEYQLAESRDNGTNQASEIESLRNSVKNLKLERDQLNTQLQEKSEMQRRLSNQVGDLTSRLSASKTQEKSLQEESESLTERIRDLEEMVQKSIFEKDTLQRNAVRAQETANAEVGKLQKMLAIMQKKYKGDLTELYNHLAVKTELIHQLSMRVEDLREQLMDRMVNDA